MSAQTQSIDCLEFHKLSLSDPNSQRPDFLLHSEACADCLKYVREVRQLDDDLRSSLAAPLPHDLIARLKLQLEYSSQGASSRFKPRYALAACAALVVAVGAALFTQQWRQQQIGEDYQRLLSAVVEHVNEVPLTPVWSVDRANLAVTTLLASYDQSLHLNRIESLQFSRICPMGEYRGLHATLSTEGGQTTFAYIRGEPLGDLLDASFAGFATRVIPVRGGNLVIVSRNQRALQQADQELRSAMYWDI